MSTMLDWLRFYNCLDTMPLVEAMSTSFEKFHEYFEHDSKDLVYGWVGGGAVGLGA